MVTEENTPWEGPKGWYYSYRGKTYGPFLTSRDAQTDLLYRDASYD